MPIPSEVPPPSQPAKTPAAGSVAEIVAWIKFAWTVIGQVEGFVPKLKAIARLRRVLK